MLDALVPAASNGQRVARGGFHQAEERRHLLLPALHALQDGVGWISEGGLNEVSRRLGVPPAEAYGVATFYALFSTTPAPAAVAHVCDDVACRAAANGDPAAGIAGSVHPGTWKRSPCLGRCESGSAVFVQHAGRAPMTIAPADPGRVAAALAGHAPPPPLPAPIPQAEGPGRGSLRLLRRIAAFETGALDSYREDGGYRALRQALERGPAAVLDEVERSNLRGRGGAAFPAAVKWRAVAGADHPERHVVCNADESEPGTFKDRVLMERDPFAVLEAMAIAGFAVGASRGWIYIRGEYPEAQASLQRAADEARRAGLLGGDILGSGFAFDVEIRRGAGAYICGEETSLFESIEGRRGEPRSKPPFPTDVGLFGRPTLVNNVETLANIPSIVLEGGEAFARLGTKDSTGTKLFCVSGAVGRPGLFEVEFGTTLGEVLDLAGGARGGLGAVLLGGAAGSFTDRMDVPLTFEGVRAAGLTLGSGAVIVFDDRTDFDAVLLRIAAFFRDESCGQCVPCRVGTVRQEEALVRLMRDGTGRGLLEDIGRAMEDASICGLGQTAASAVRSALGLGLIGGGT